VTRFTKTLFHMHPNFQAFIVAYNELKFLKLYCVIWLPFDTKSNKRRQLLFVSISEKVKSDHMILELLNVPIHLVHLQQRN